MVASRSEFPEKNDGDSLAQRILAAASAGQSRISDADQELTLEEAIEKVSDLEIGGLFASLTDLIRSQLRAAGPSSIEREQVKHCYRQSFGVRYSSMLLTSLALDEEPNLQETDPVLRSAQAIVEESLQWHDDSVLGHVLIYYIDSTGEVLFHECAMVAEKGFPEDELAARLTQFRAALSDYVRTYGSSVRTKEHLRLTALPSELGSPKNVGRRFRTGPLNDSKGLVMGSDRLQLPAESEGLREGDEALYLDLVRSNLGAVLNLKSKDFEFSHFSAGSDDVGEASVRATAHLYIVFRNINVDRLALDFRLAMKEALSRLTIAFVLNRLNRANTKLMESRRIERQQHKQFEERIERMRGGMRELQGQAEAIISTANPSVWVCLVNWISYIEDLSSNQTFNPKTVRIGDLIETQSNHDWKDGQWAMALLKLVNATEDDFADRKDMESTEAWGELCDAISLKSRKEGAFIHPMWRCIDRMGFPIEASHACGLMDEIKTTCMINDKALRRSFVRQEREDHLFTNNGFTVLALQFAIGSEYYPPKEGGLDCARAFYFPTSLRSVTVMNGINILHDVLHDKKFTGKRRAEIEFLASKAPVLSVKLDIRHLPKFDCNGLFDQMKTILKKERQHFPDSISNVSMAVFAALGLDEESWTQEISRIEFLPDRVVRRDQDCQEIAWFTKGTDSLTVFYRVSESASTTR